MDSTIFSTWKVRQPLRTTGTLLLEQQRQGGCNDLVLDELAVVSRQPKEAMQPARRTWGRPGCHDLHLVAVHGDIIAGDDVTEVGDGQRPQDALGMLDKELVVTKDIEDGLDVLQMLGQGCNID